AGDAHGHGDDEARLEAPRAIVDLFDEVAEHGLGNLEIADHAVFERAHGFDVAGAFVEHVLGGVADGHAAIDDLAGTFVDGNDGRLAQHDALPAHANRGVGGTQVDAHVQAEDAQ